MDSFQQFFDTFKTTELWKAMENTHEDSPWHREESVAVHTQMLLNWYQQNYFTDRTQWQRDVSRVACLFHDVGKPPAQIIKFSEERGEYRAYHGHEQLSARIWVDYAMQNIEVLGLSFGFTVNDVALIAQMLEYHVPFAIKDQKKRLALKTSIYKRGEAAGQFRIDAHTAWIDFLNCDQNGRISDGQAEKLAVVSQWMEEWEKIDVK